MNRLFISLFHSEDDNLRGFCGFGGFGGFGPAGPLPGENELVPVWVGCGGFEAVAGRLRLTGWWLDVALKESDDRVVVNPDEPGLSGGMDGVL